MDDDRQTNRQRSDEFCDFIASLVLRTDWLIKPNVTEADVTELILEIDLDLEYFFRQCPHMERLTAL